MQWRKLFTFLGAIWDKYALNLVLIEDQINPEITPPNGSICDEFNKQHYHQSIKKAPCLLPGLALFYTNMYGAF